MKDDCGGLTLAAVMLPVLYVTGGILLNPLPLAIKAVAVLIAGPALILYALYVIEATINYIRKVTK